MEERVSYFSIKSDCFSIPCKLYAPGSGEPEGLVIGVHGFAGDKESSALEALARRLLPRRWAVLCFDFPAHGESPHGGGDLTVENCRRCLEAACDYGARRYPRAELAIFATSFGGYITLLSLQSLPVKRLVLRAPAVAMEKVFREKILAEPLESFRKRGYATCGFDRKMQVGVDFYLGLVRHDAFAVRPAIPTLMIRAMADELVDPEDLARYASLCPKARLLDIPGAGHRFKGPGELDAAINAAEAFLTEPENQ